MSITRRNLTCSLLAIAGVSFATAVSAQHQPPPPPMEGGDMIFDVRNGDQTGKLMLRETELAFESLSDARHSRNWKYVDLREVSRKGRGIRVRPFHGGAYDFQFKDKPMRDRVYDLISQRVVFARQVSK